MSVGNSSEVHFQSSLAVKGGIWAARRELLPVVSACCEILIVLPIPRMGRALEDGRTWQRFFSVANVIGFERLG